MKIRNYSLLTASCQLYRNAELYASGENADMLYARLACDYPKFYKMDPLAKTAFLLAEVLMKEGTENREATGILGWNRFSSYHSDIRHLENMQSGIPGPGVFVYTLPNIALGEIAIRHGITGENIFFVAPDLPAGEIIEVLEPLFTNGHERVLAGWIEAGPLSAPSGFICDITNSIPSEKITEQELLSIHQLLLL